MADILPGSVADDASLISRKEVQMRLHQWCSSECVINDATLTMRNEKPDCRMRTVSNNPAHLRVNSSSKLQKAAQLPHLMQHGLTLHEPLRLCDVSIRLPAVRIERADLCGVRLDATNKVWLGGAHGRHEALELPHELRRQGQCLWSLQQLPICIRGSGATCLLLGAVGRENGCMVM